MARSGLVGGGGSGDYPWSAFLYDLTHGGGGGPSGGGAGPSSGGRSGDPVPKGKTSGGGSTDWNKWKENFQYGVKLFVPGWINSGAALTDLQKGNYVGATIHGLIFAGEWGLIFMTRGRAEQYLVPYHQKLLVQQYLAQAERTVAETGLQYSDDLVKAAQKLYPKLAGKIQLHHRIPQYLGGAKNQVLVPLDAAYHQQITNAFRAEWGYGLGMPTAAELQAIMNKVYSQFPLPK